jgi:hypothetical protein
MSLLNLGQQITIDVGLFNLISRIVMVDFGIDLTRTSTSWCKIREFCIFTLSLVTLTRHVSSPGSSGSVYA